MKPHVSDKVKQIKRSPSTAPFACTGRYTCLTSLALLALLALKVLLNTTQMVKELRLSVIRWSVILKLVSHKSWSSYKVPYLVILSHVKIPPY